MMDEIKAHEILEKAGYKIDKGFIILHKPISEETVEENEAINYLCAEWDYSTRFKESK